MLFLKQCSHLVSLPGTIQMFVPVSPHQIPDITTLFITLHSQSVMFVTPDIRLSSWHLMTFLIQISFLFPFFAVPTWHLISAPNGESITIDIYTHTHSMPFLKQCSHLAALPGTIQMFVPVSPHQIPDITALFITLHSQYYNLLLQ